MMHYFLGREVWKNTDGISLVQGKYGVDILKSFRMMVSKAMTTPMASNLKLLSVASLEPVDATMYRQMIGLIDVPDEYETRYLLYYEHIETCSPDGCKACSEVPEEYS